MLLNWKTLVVTGLRASTLFAKLIFTIILVRFMSVEEFGQWVLIVAVITYGIFVVGAELYNITLRNYISNGYTAAIPQFSAQWSYFAMAYVVIIVIGFVVSQNAESGLYKYAFLIAIILVLEHFTHEFHRLAFFRDQQVHANAILFIKSAGWMIPAGAYFFVVPVAATLGTVLGCWAVGTAIGAAYAFLTYRRIFKGLRASYVPQFAGKLGHVFSRLAPFLVVTISLRTPLVLDRYLIEHFFGPAQLGAYGYYATFGNGVQAIFDAVILARLTPRLLSERREYPQQIAIIRSFVRQSVLFWILSIAGLFLVVPYLNIFVGKASFQEAFSLLLILLAGQMVFSLASVLHYGLYSLHRDRQLANGALCYMALAIVLYFALIPHFGSFGAAAALAIAACGLFALRIHQLLRDDPI
jgi:O-antigen/teichoic acid export membrane protein